MELSELKAIVEALIFVSEEPITDNQLTSVLEEIGITKEELSVALEDIKRNFNEDQSRGLQLSQVAGGYQFRTKESCASWIQKLSVPKPVKLSQAGLETLAIIAYRQPIVRSEIEGIRGVDAGGVLKTLLERDLIRIIGRRDEPGQPLIYGTTKGFLETFNLKNLHELPTLTDIEELARRRVETQTPAQLSLVNLKGDEEIINDEDEEEEEDTEVIPRKEEEEEEDEEALTRIEHGLKQLRRLEREIFPKPVQENQDAKEADSENPPQDAPPETDSSGN